MTFEDLSSLAIDKALTLGADYAEVRFQREIDESIVVKNGRLETLRRRAENGMGVRVLVNGALGFTATNILTEREVEDCVEECVKIARRSSKLVDTPVKLVPSQTNEVEYLVAEKIKWSNVDLREKMEFLKDLDREVLGGGNDVKYPFRVFELKYSVEEKVFENSEGTSITSRVPRVGATYILTCVKDSESIQRVGQVGGTGGWEVLINTDFQGKVQNDSKALRKVLLEGESPPKEAVSLIVGSEVAGIIAHEAVGHPFEADRVLGRESAQGGESYMKADGIGLEIGSGELYVSDDPTIPSSYGYYLYDDEGVKARKRTLVKEGKTEEFLHDRETAAILGVGSNGAARTAGYSFEPIIRMANTYFEPGDYSFEELVEDVKLGVYIKSFMEWNIDDRRVNQRYVGLEAYLIEGGEIKKPVKHPIIETTTFELLSKLEARGRDLSFWAATCGKGDPMQAVPVWAGGPHLKFSGIRLSGR